VPTIGVSLAVPEPWGSRLQAFRVANGDAQGATIPTHITLVPPVEVGEERWEGVERHLARVAAACPSYAVHLRGSGTFRPVSPVVFVNLVEGISWTERLAQDCRRGPLLLDLDFPFHPHVTVAHLADDEVLDRAFDELAGFDCTFTVEAFHLYVHDDDHGWTAVRDFALTGSAG
jgi:2'-5' RNA ligase